MPSSLLYSRRQPSALLFVTSQYYFFKVSIVSLSVCYVIALFSASTLSSSLCYVNIHVLSIQGFHCFSICLLCQCSVFGFSCSIFCLLGHYRPTISLRFQFFSLGLPVCYIIAF